MNRAASYPCSRCCGNGQISVYSNVLGGICFKCGGSGRQTRKPSPPTFQWAVFFLEISTGELAHAYNQTGRTEKAAIEKARAIYAKAPEAFRQRFDTEQATACHVSEVSICPQTGKVVRK
jgi:hypothetical protein